MRKREATDGKAEARTNLKISQRHEKLGKDIPTQVKKRLREIKHNKPWGPKWKREKNMRHEK